LGLSIVKHLAQIQAGEVTADSQPGRGSVFTVRLPRAG
jgi:two-component system, OmpR family, sensor histidine kinase SenX3